MHFFEELNIVFSYLLKLIMISYLACPRILAIDQYHLDCYLMLYYIIYLLILAFIILSVILLLIRQVD